MDIHRLTLVPNKKKIIKKLFKKKVKQQTCLIGIKLIDGVIEFSKSKCLELLTTDVGISECELVGAFEFESAECGEDGECPFGGQG